MAGTGWFLAAAADRAKQSMGHLTPGLGFCLKPGGFKAESGLAANWCPKGQIWPCLVWLVESWVCLFVSLLKKNKTEVSNPLKIRLSPYKFRHGYPGPAFLDGTGHALSPHSPVAIGSLYLSPV